VKIASPANTWKSRIFFGILSKKDDGKNRLEVKIQPAVHPQAGLRGPAVLPADRITGFKSKRRIFKVTLLDKPKSCMRQCPT